MVKVIITTAIALFIIYNIASIIVGGTPTSISSTYYVWEEKFPKYGWLFRMMFIVMGLLLAIPMLALGEGSPWQFTGFLAPAGLIFTGAAADFKHKDKIDKIVHPVSALTCGIAAVLWEHFIFGTLFFFVLSFLFCLAVSLTSNTIKNCYTFWIETACFFSFFCCLINICYF